MLWSSTSRLSTELTIYDNLYTIFEKQDKCLYQVTSNSVRGQLAHSNIFMVCNLVCINKMNYSELRQLALQPRVSYFVMKISINVNLQININENIQMCRMVRGTCNNAYARIQLHVYMRIQIGRHTWIVRCRFSDNDCLLIRLQSI